MADIELNFNLHDKQMKALLTDATEVLFGGATRGGKSYFSKVFILIMCQLVPGLQVLVLRKYFDDVIQNFMEGPDGLRVMARGLQEHGLVKITQEQIRWTKSESLITLAHCSTEEAALHAQGIPKNILVCEEATQLLERHIRMIRAWVTISEPMRANIPKEVHDLGITLPKIIYTANPIGPSVGYFRRAFVKPQPEGTVWQAPQDDGGFSRVYICSRVEDNPHESTEAAIRRVSGIGDAAISDALLTGNWDAPVGDFFPQYSDADHTCPVFTPPKHWFKYMAFDWGSSEPFAVVWACVSDGVEFAGPMNQKLWFPAGAIIIYREWYGCDPSYPAKGLQMRNEQIAQGIIERTTEETSGLVLADSLPFQDRGSARNGKKFTIADEFALHGVKLTMANTRRVTGWSYLRDRLIGQNGVPLLYLQEHCQYCRDYLPALERDKNKPEDAVSDGEATHICLAGNTLVKTPAGPVQIKSIKAGDFVYGGDGQIRPVSDAGLTRKKANVIKLTFDSGFEIVCTPDHKIMTHGGWIKAIDAMSYFCIIEPCSLSSLATHVKNSTTRNTASIQRSDILQEGKPGFMSLFGDTIMGLSQKVFASITRIITRLTMLSKILRLCAAGSTPHITAGKEIGRNSQRFWNESGHLLLNGTAPKPAGSGIRNTTKKTSTSSTKPTNVNAKTVRNLTQQKRSLKSFATSIVRWLGIESTAKPCALKQRVSIAERNSGQSNIIQHDFAQGHTQQKTDTKTIQCVKIEKQNPIDVYCLTEPISKSFQLHNGLIVKNCDCLRYVAAARPLTKPLETTSQSFQKSGNLTPKQILKRLKQDNGRTIRIG